TGRGGARRAELGASPRPRPLDYSDAIRTAERHRAALASGRGRASLTPEGQLSAGLIGYDHYCELLELRQRIDSGETPYLSRGLVQSDITGREIDYQMGRHLLLPARVAVFADVVEVKAPYSRPHVEAGKR